MDQRTVPTHADDETIPVEDARRERCGVFAGLPKLRFPKPQMPALDRLRAWDRDESLRIWRRRNGASARGPGAPPVRAGRANGGDSGLEQGISDDQSAQIHAGVSIATGILLAAATLAGLIWLASESMRMVVDSMRAFVE